MLNKYSKSLSYDDVDLFKSYNPPKDLYVEVRALVDIGNINIKDSEQIRIEKNHTYNIKKSDVELYLRKGLMVINE